jgi:hypothetical protein
MSTPVPDMLRRHGVSASFYPQEKLDQAILPRATDAGCRTKAKPATCNFARNVGRICLSRSLGSNYAHVPSRSYSKVTGRLLDVLTIEPHT